MGVSWFKRGPGHWSHIHFPQLKMAYWCYSCSRSRNKPSRNAGTNVSGVILFPLQSAKAIFGSCSGWKSFQVRGLNESSLLSSAYPDPLAKKDVVRCGVIRRCARWAILDDSLSDLCTEQLWLCCIQEATANLVPKSENEETKSCCSGCLILHCASK